MAEPESEPLSHRDQRTLTRGRSSPRLGGTWTYFVLQHIWRPDLRGLHCGGMLAWHAIERTTPFERLNYQPPGLAVRRYATLAEATAAYYALRAQYHLPPEPRVWHHTTEQDI